MSQGTRDTGSQPEKATPEPRSRGAKSTDGESAVLASIAEMPEPDRGMAQRLHAIIKATAPGLSSKLWYGMPAYTLDGEVVCFFQGAQKFKTRFATFGFQQRATLDEGNMWPVAFALTALTDVEEEQIRRLVKKATGGSSS